MKFLSKLIGFSFLLSIPTYVFSQSLDVVQLLNLGKVVIIDNSTVSSVTITKEGLARRTGGLLFIETGQPAIIEASDFTPNRRLYISIDVLQASTVTDLVSNEQFRVVEYDHLDYLQTDSEGFAEIYVGATFETSGSGSENFRDAEYKATYSITVNY